MVSAYLDESSDKRKQIVLSVGGIVAPDPFLQQIEGLWMDRLNRDNVLYFRYSDCKGLHGSFFHFRKKFGDGAQQRANDVLADLESILLSVPWVGFGLGVIIKEYKGVLTEFPELSTIYMDDPIEAAYGQMMYEIARAVRKNAPGHEVSYIADKSSDYLKVAGAFLATKVNHPVIARTMTTVAPLDDKQTPPLQMADLIVGKIRESFAAWLLNPKRTLNEEWSDEWNSHIANVGIWNRAHMLRSARVTIARARSGRAAIRPLPKPSPTETKRREKARRKYLRGTSNGN